MVDTTQISSRGKSMTVEVYTPTGEMASSVVIIAYGSDGLTDDLNGPWATMIQGYADSLLDKGFTVIVPVYLAVTDT
jgi:dienelactone hydrolase